MTRVTLAYDPTKYDNILVCTFLLSSILMRLFTQNGIL